MKKNTFNINNLKLKFLSLFLGMHILSFGNIKENEVKSINFLPPVVTRTSTDIFYIDLGASTPINSAYASYTISSPVGSSIINDLWVEISNFSDVSAVEATSVNLASNESSIVNLGTLSAGNSATAFFYLTATAATLTDQTHIIKVYDGKPGAGGVLLNGATGTTMTFLSVESAISAASNKVATSIVGPTSNALGGLMTMTVTGNTGTVGAAKIFSVSPASFANWNPTAYELINSQFTFAYGAGTADDISYSNQLKFVLGSTTSTDYTLVFTFRAVTTTSSPTVVSPISSISSGAQIKHTTLDAAFLALAPINSAQNFLTLTKSTSTPILTSGGTGLYTITLTNTSTQALLVDDITDIMPLGTAYVAGTSSFGGLPITNPTITGQSLVWGNSSNFSIPASGSVSLTFSATIPNTKGTYTNSAYGNVGATQIDTTLSTTDDSKATASIAVDNPPVAVDDNYTFTVNSTGNVLNLKANDTDIDGDSLTVVSINGIVLTPGTAQNISVPDGTIFVSSTGAISFSSAVNYSGSINFDYVISDGIVTDTGGVSIVVTPESNVGVTKTVDNETPALGSNVIFTIVANNAGPSTATSVNVNDLLPTGYTYLSSTVTTGTYTSGTGLWAIGTVVNGVSQTLTITATVNATGSYANTATIAANEVDPTLANNSATSTPTPVVATQANVSIAKTVNNATPNVGDTVTFTLTASNAGPSAATGVNVTDLLPSGYTFVSATTAAGTYTSGTGVWSIGSLANGASATLSITATVNATGSYANMATISANEADPAPGNNTSTSTPVPVPQANVSVSKTVNNTTPNVGDNVTFTLTASNAGSSASTGVTVNDLLPLGYTYVSSTTATGTYTSGTGVWVIGSLSNGSSATLSITATVNATGSYANTATISANEADPTPGNNTSTSTPVPVPQSNVGITKTSSSATPNVGDNVTFTLTANNAGPSAATGVSVTDLLPAGYTYVSSTTATGIYTSGTGVWAIGSLANGASATLSIVATVNATGSYANTATIAANEVDSTPGNNASTSTPVPVPQSNVSIAKTVDNAMPNVGDTVTFTLTASNAGPSAATGVNVTDLLPSGYTFVSATTAAGTYTSGTGVWSIGSLANGASATLSITATVNATGSYANMATISANEADPAPGNNTSTSTPVPVPQANVSVSKTVNNTTPNVGDNVTFTLTASNAGSSASTGVTVNDLLPLGYTYVSSTTATGTYTSGTGVWVIGSLSNGSSATLSITATVNATGSYANTATISANEADPTPGNNTSTSTPVPVPQSNVGITKTSSSATPNVGDNVTFTLTANNAGPSAATGVSVTDLLPAGYTYVSSTTATGIYTSGTGVWAIGSLANGASATLSIVATVNATGSYANTATIAANEVDSTPGNNASTSTPVPVPQSNVSIAKTVDNAMPNVGDTVTFTLTASNAGPSAASGVAVNDLLPSGYTYVSSTTATGTYTSGTGVWAIGSLANGASATLSIVATVNATGSYANTATIAANETDPTPANNTSTSTPTPVVATQSNVSIAKTVDNAMPNVGDTVTFTLTASNAGPSAASGVAVNDLLPSGYTYVSSTTATGTYTSGTGVWAIGSLANGASATLSIVATVNATGSYANTATIAANETDPTPANNTSTSTPTPVVATQSNVSVAKTVNNATPNVGDTVTFTLTASNAGPSAATGVNVADLLPSGYTFVSVTTAAGTYTSGTGVWDIGSLANGASATLSIVATVNATGSYANTATIAANETDPTPANNTSTSTPTPVVATQSNVSVAKTVNNATPNVGDTVTFTLTASNAGPSAATGVNVTDLLPSGYTFVSATTAAGTYTSGTGVWDIGSLANGASATLSIVATVNATGSYANTATIAANETDPTPANNTSTSTPVPVDVIDAVIDAVSDGPTFVATATTPKIILSVINNDTLNTIVVTVANSDVTPITTGPLSIDIDGNLTLAANTPSGTYTVVYEICEVGASPANCDQASVTVVVANAIVA
ncbi:hypothetical protein QLS31_12090, partial [Flavobacterium sp. XS2P24]|nr:hypothetical protein [Flavobacterium sp. XS2P24]